MYKKKPTANRRESRPSGSQNRICSSSLSQSSYAVLLVPSSGTFGQILSAPQRLLLIIYIICCNSIILELKANTKLTNSDISQILHYLKATGIKAGVLFNFGKKGKLEWMRFVYSDEKYLKNENKKDL